MKSRSARVLFAGFAGAVSILLVCGVTFSAASGNTSAAQPAPVVPLSVDYPLNGTLFPQEITPPNFLWHDPSTAATRWKVTVHFAGEAPAIQLVVPGDLLKMGHVDPQAGPAQGLAPQQASTHTWRPDAVTWARIKRLSVHSKATVTFTGLAEGSQTPVSTGKVTFRTSVDPVGAPIFYRDVPLMLPTPDQKGPITPLPPSAIPLIRWEIRNIAEPKSHLVMTNLPTCANCHSFSSNGKMMGLDLDGPRNDKGLYAIVPVQKLMTIRNKDVIHWSSFHANGVKDNAPVVKRFGFMSQISPNGRYVVTSIGPPNNSNTHQNQEPGFAPGILDRLYSTNYRDLSFTQVFFPTRGILAYYDRKLNSMRPLPGADDPNYVQTSAFWSPDGKYLIFSRALARDPYPPGVPKPLHANDPQETQIQYDLYKIPFNEGRGGTAVPVEGASNNGISNDFPKVSPDGRWIVFVENKNGLLMRPDSRLFIVPFSGGKARLMTCNTRLMNSWHTFSPNGHWLAFSSKARGPYTRLMLTHIDANGHDTPPVIVEDMTAYNRAVNIPEFVNIPEDGLEKIDPQATNFYRLFDDAFKQMEENRIPESIQTFREAIAQNPDDALTHYVLATVLTGNNQEHDALAEYRKASELAPENATFLDHLAVSLDLSGDAAGAVEQLRKAIALEPNSAEYRFNLGVVMESRGDFAAAIEPFLRAIELSHGQNWRAFAALARAYDKSGHPAEAVQAARQALKLAVEQHDNQNAIGLQDALESYQRDLAHGGMQ
ncbi:MAG TPA: tetratricopeptide repeat protein [Terracidiphilus sp.]|nr:tetratricopeptide repeat protein [Terracidiphilus sp.]